MRFLILIGVAVALLVPAQASACDGAGVSLKPSTVKKVRTATRCLLNRERAEAGVARLKRSGRLQGLAQPYATRMVEEDFFSHTDPSGATRERRFKEAGYDHRNGEILVDGITTASELVRIVRESPIHGPILRDKRFRFFGVGIAVGDGRRRCAITVGTARR